MGGFIVFREVGEVRFFYDLLRFDFCVFERVSERLVFIFFYYFWG